MILLPLTKRKAKYILIYMNTLNDIQIQIRNQFIWEANQKGLSLQEIADLFQQSLSKSRIHQIIININAKKINK